MGQNSSGNVFAKNKFALLEGTPPPCKCYPGTKLRRAPYDVKNFGVVVLGPALESKKMMQKNIVFFLWGMHGVKNDLDCIKCFIQMENKCIMQIIMPDFQGSL